MFELSIWLFMMNFVNTVRTLLIQKVTILLDKNGLVLVPIDKRKTFSYISKSEFFKMQPLESSNRSYGIVKYYKNFPLRHSISSYMFI